MGVERTPRQRGFLVSASLLFLLALFAVCPALPAQDSRHEAILLAPSEIQAGGQSAVTVTTFDQSGAERRPADLPVSLFLVRDGSRIPLGSARTGATGHVQISFEVPALDKGVYELAADIEGISSDLTAELTLTSAPAILIETDKPIYKPGQTLQGRVLLLDNALRPRPGALELTIHDAKGIRIDRQNLTANDFGIAPFELRLATEVNLGVWKIKVSSEGVESSRDVRVEHYVLPRYDLSANFSESWVLVSEPIEGSVEARYFFGKPVEGTVEVVARRFVADWEVFARAEGVFTDGRFDFQLPPVGFIAGTPGNNGLGTITLDIEATDSTGYSQSTRDVLTVAEAPVVINLISRSRTLKSKIPAEVLVVTEEPDGTPRDETVVITATFQKFDGTEIRGEPQPITTTNGVADFSIVPPDDITRGIFTARHSVAGQGNEAKLELGVSFSPTSSFLSVSRAGSRQPAQIGEELVFRATATHPGTVYYDVYAGGRTVFSGVSENREIRFFASPEMAPSARLAAYIINPDNEISADTTSFEVVFPTTISVDTTLSKDDLRPGDEITLTVQACERSMIGLAIVDRSVLALGKSRLHLGEVFAELERRFMEPQAETHAPPGGVEPPIGGPIADFGPGIPGGGWHNPGVTEILAEIGLTLVATDGISLPLGRDFLPWLRGGVLFDAVAEAAGPPAAPDDGAGGSETPEDPVRVRQFFPETWVWQPTLLTDDSGSATLQLTVPDSITSWEISSVVSCPDGIGFGRGEATVFQEFFVEPVIPVAVTRNEEFPIQVQIFNYLDGPQRVSLEFGSGKWYELLGDAGLSVDVPGGSAISAQFPIRPILVGEHQVEVLARGDRMSDAVIRTIRVEPEGEPVEEVFNSVIEAGQTLTLDTSIPEFAIADSGKAFLHITPSPIAQTLTGVSDLLGMPYGCGEQNMIFLAPDVEILRYLKITDELMPEVQAEAEHFINVGYQRELTFQADDGGFAAFGGEKGSLWLTAFVLSTFSIAREVRDIDETVLSRAANMLVGRQKSDGSFETDDFLIHKEMDGGLDNIYAMAAYVANALADYGGAEIATALQKAATFLRDRRSTVDDDAYSLSIAAVALGKIPGFETTSSQVIDRLLELAIREGVGMHWEPYPIETTGYVAIAMLDQDRPEAAAAVEWLSTQRNSLGGYGQSTQDTVVAIRALTRAALKIRAVLDVTLTVRNGDSTIAALQVDQSNYDILQSVELPVGHRNGITLESAGRGNVGFQVARKYHVPGDRLPPPRDMTIDVSYDATGIEVDDLVDVIVRVAYTGIKKETGMTIVDIAVPTGFQAVRSTLDRLVEEKIASRVDVAGRKVIIYIDSLVRGTPVNFRFQVKALYPVRAEPPISKVYEYYDREVQATTRGPTLVVRPREPGPGVFIRGDANGDDSLDISDPVTILNFLFLGLGSIDCLDSADLNDDETVNITDPIYILNYLFQGGSPPPSPFPAPGEDPEGDELGC